MELTSKGELKEKYEVVHGSSGGIEREPVTSSQYHHDETPRQSNARANDGAKIRTPSSGKNMIDKKEFAQKLQKVQDDIRLRNQIQEQRELELDKLQQDFQEQITDAKSKTSAQ